MTQNIYDFPDRKQIEEEAGEVEHDTEYIRFSRSKTD